MKAEALAKALPAALAAPAVQGRVETHSNSIRNTVPTSTVTTLDSNTVKARGPALGAPGLSGQTTAVGRLPRPPAGPLTTEWSRRGETERKTVLLDRPFPVRDSVRETVPALVPRDRHTAHTSDIRRSTARPAVGRSYTYHPHRQGSSTPIRSAPNTLVATSVLGGGR